MTISGATGSRLGPLDGPTTSLLGTRVVQGTDSASGPDLFAVHGDGAQTVVTGLTLDGQQLWQVVGEGGNEGAAPDGRGGLLLTQSLCDENRPISIRNVDETGKQVWELTGVGRVGDLRA